MRLPRALGDVTSEISAVLSTIAWKERAVQEMTSITSLLSNLPEGETMNLWSMVVCLTWNSSGVPQMMDLVVALSPTKGAVEPREPSATELAPYPCM